MTYTIKALDESTWDAFAALVEANNGVFGGCWCIGFHAEGRDRNDAASQPRAEARAGASRARRTPHSCSTATTASAGASSGRRPSCRASRAARSTRRASTTPADWRIACNFVGKGHRRKGVATAGLAGALDLIAKLGGGTVEGFPEAADSVPAGFLFNGALSTYEQLGFVRDRKIGKHRWVVTKRVRRRRALSLLRLDLVFTAVEEYACGCGGSPPSAASDRVQHAHEELVPQDAADRGVPVAVEPLKIEFRKVVELLASASACRSSLIRTRSDVSVMNASLAEESDNLRPTITKRFI